MSGDISLQSGFADYAWLCVEELRERLGVAKRAKYFDAIEPVLNMN